MTRIALIADIHGNAVALRSVLAEIERLEVDRIVCLGDVVAGGPQPREVVRELRERGIPSVMGNADDEILHPSDPSQEQGDMVKIIEICNWNAGQMSDDELDFLAGFRPTLTLDADGQELALCVHGSPRSFDDIIHAASDAGELDAMLAGVTAPVLAAAHTHFPFMRRHRELLVLNPGSVGRPYDPAPPGSPIMFAPWAEFAILEFEDGGLSVNFQRVGYDISALHAAARASGMPHAAWWVGMWTRT
jgi:predicted phosphodiesterase